MAKFEPLLDLLDVMRRRALLILGIFLLGFAGSVFLGLGQKPVYESTETLGIAAPRIAPDLVTTTVSEPLVSQLPSLRRYLLSDTVLSDINTAYTPFADTGLPAFTSPESALRSAVTINVLPQQNDQSTSDIVITARMDDPENARLIAQEIGHRLIKTSVQNRIGEARATLDFLIEAEQSIQADLWTLQSRYAAFRRDNADLLEGGEQMRASEMAALSDALVDIERERAVLEHEMDATKDDALRDDLDARLDSLHRQRSALQDQREELARNMLIPSGFVAEVQGYERELARLRDDLAKASSNRSRAEAGLEVESRRQSERLIVTNPATFPTVPVIDTRGTVVALGGMVSIILALVIALILDMRNPLMRNAAQMQRQTGITPLATIPFRTPRPSAPRTSVSSAEDPAEISPVKRG